MGLLKWNSFTCYTRCLYCDACIQETFSFSSFANLCEFLSWLELHKICWTQSQSHLSFTKFSKKKKKKKKSEKRAHTNFHMITISYMLCMLNASLWCRNSSRFLVGTSIGAGEGHNKTELWNHLIVCWNVSQVSLWWNEFINSLVCNLLLWGQYDTFSFGFLLVFIVVDSRKGQEVLLKIINSNLNENFL